MPQPINTEGNSYTNGDGIQMAATWHQQARPYCIKGPARSWGEAAAMYVPLYQLLLKLATSPDFPEPDGSKCWWEELLIWASCLEEDRKPEEHRQQVLTKHLKLVLAQCTHARDPTAQKFRATGALHKPMWAAPQSIGAMATKLRCLVSLPTVV